MDDSNANQGIGKKCSKCGKSSVEGAIFGVRKVQTKDGPSLYEKPTCKACENEYSKQRRQDHPDKIAEIKQRYHERHHGTIKHHVQEKISTWRKASCVPSDLTVDYLVSLYEKQKGRCFYSDEEMIFGWVDGKVHHNSLSLDKLDPAKGYVQGNVVWCTYLVNTMKQDMTEQQFYDSVNQIFETTYGVVMTNSSSLKEKVLAVMYEARLGDLPKIVEKQITAAAQKGLSEIKIHFLEPPKGIVPFYASLGPANQEIWKDICRRFDRQTKWTDIEFTEYVVRDLAIVTGLEIEFLKWPHQDPAGANLPYLNQENFKDYYPIVCKDPSLNIEHSVVLKVKWA